MSKLHISFLMALLTVLSCSPKTTGILATYNGLPITDLCDLPNYQGRKVYLKCSYSGIEEYWSPGSLKSKECTSSLLVDLDFSDDYKMPSRFEHALTSVHNSYWNSYLLIEALGRYETKQDGGYGHLGTNKSRFVISEVISMKLVHK